MADAGDSEHEPTLQIWGIVGPSGEMLYGHNAREEVEREYQRRIAEDPRLARVIHISELTLAFPSREREEPGGEEQTLCVLPWLPLDEPVDFGDVTVEQWSHVREHVDSDARETADQLLSGFKDHSGADVDPVVCWLRDRHPTAKLPADDVDRVRLHTFLLALAGITENIYLGRWEQLNSTHARRLFLNFQIGQPQIRTTRRRREGWASSRVRYSRLLLTRPMAAEGRPTAGGEHRLLTLYHPRLLSSLAECVDGDDALSKAIRQSVVPFLRGNEMDEYGTPEQDVIWLVAALEQLIGLALEAEPGRRGSQLGIRAADVFSGWPREARTLFRRWMTDLLSLRHEIHGRPATKKNWQPWAHALLASVLYPLVVKALLAQQGRYMFDAWDARQAAAFPIRIRVVQGSGPHEQDAVCQAWHEALVNVDADDGRIVSIDGPGAPARSEPSADDVAP